MQIKSITQTERCVTNYPVLRRGAIIQADSTLTDDDSIRVGEEILNRACVFQTRMTKCFRGDNSFIEFKPGEKARGKYAQTPIIDFPLFTVDLGKFRCNGRVSLTVCNYARQSKIWSRLSLSSVGGEHAYAMKSRDTSSFFAIADRMAALLVKGTLSQYEKILSRLSIAERIEQKYGFRLRGINSSDQALEGFLKAMAGDEAGELSTAFVQNEYRVPLSPLLRMSFGPGRVALTTAAKRLSHRDWSVHLQEQEQQLPRMTAVSTCFTGKRQTRVDTLCFNQEAERGERPPALIATRRTLIRFARCF